MEIMNYTFKEICNKTGYTASAIRYYEKEFNLAIPRDANGRRIFTKIEFDKLLFIKELQKQNFANPQIKKILSENSNHTDSAMDEVALTDETKMPVSLNLNKNDKVAVNDGIINYIDKKFQEVNLSLSELNQNVTGKERDILISENVKLKMELKRKSYEIIELKENLRFYKSENKGFFKKLFGKK